MIVVMEGPSAVGKTTWCRSHCPDILVEEASEDIQAPSLGSDPAEVAEFWSHFNAELWQAGLEMERKHGIAVFDSDPFHLYFSWGLWKVDFMTRALFEKEAPLYWRAIELGRIGFADYIVWREAPLDELRRRAKADPTRGRRRHEVYLSLVPWMKSWFEAREKVLPGSVISWSPEFRLQDLGPSRVLPHRHDPSVLDRMIAALDQPRPTAQAR
jgi:hypothetical protein